jgi:hypothetical protein
MTKSIKTLTHKGRRYEVVMEMTDSVVVNLHEDQIHGHVSRNQLLKKDLNPFWRRRIGIEKI